MRSEKLLERPENIARITRVKQHHGLTKSDIMRKKKSESFNWDISYSQNL